MDTPLYVEPFTVAHLPHLQQWLEDPAVHRNLYALYRPMNMEELRRWLAREQEDSASIFFYRTTSAARTDTAAGMGLVHYIHPQHGCGELSLIVNPVCWGRGFGRRILAHLMETAFNEHRLHKIFLHCAGPNTRMIGIAQRAGFVQEALYREEIRLDGTWHNTYRFGMLESEYAQFLKHNPGGHNVLKPSGA